MSGTGLKSCSNCGKCSDSLVSGFGFASENGLELSVGIKSAVFTVFEGRLDLQDEEEDSQDKIMWEMCVQCGAALSDLYRFYMEFMKLCDQNAFLQSVLNSNLIQELATNKSMADEVKCEEQRTHDDEDDEIQYLHDTFSEEQMDWDGDEDEEDDNEVEEDDLSEEETQPSASVRSSEGVKSIGPRSRSVSKSPEKLKTVKQGQEETKDAVSSIDTPKKSLNRPSGSGMKAVRKSPPPLISVTPTVVKDKKYFQCDMCKAVFANEEFLNKHRATSHNQIWECRSCGVEFRMTRDLKEHKRSAEHQAALVAEREKRLAKSRGRPKSTRIWECNICDFEFKTRKQLIEHKSTPEHKGVLAIKKAEFASNKTKKKILGVGFECPLCQKTFGRDAKFDWHMIVVHEIGEKKPELICDICEKYYATPSDLTFHKESAHCPDDEKNYQCYMCGLRFGVISRLNWHISNTHQKKDPLGYKCDFCDKVYEYEKGKRDHMILKHTNQDIFVCSICGKTSDNPEFLEAHMKTMHNEDRLRNVSCTICGSMFYDEASLHGHQRRMHMESKELRRKFECAMCPKVYISRSAMKEHFRAEHRGERLQCNVCGKLFKCRSTLAVHRKAFHSGNVIKVTAKKVGVSKSKTKDAEDSTSTSSGDDKDTDNSTDSDDDVTEISPPAAIPKSAKPVKKVSFVVVPTK